MTPMAATVATFQVMYLGQLRCIIDAVQGVLEGALHIAKSFEPVLKGRLRNAGVPFISADGFSKSQTILSFCSLLSVLFPSSPPYPSIYRPIYLSPPHPLSSLLFPSVSFFSFPHYPLIIFPNFASFWEFQPLMRVATQLFCDTRFAAVVFSLFRSLNVFES